MLDTANTDSSHFTKGGGSPVRRRSVADAEARACVAFSHEMGMLKRHRRQGWWIAGVRDPESVAEHSFRTGVIAYVLACMEGANPDRAAALALFHDTQEARTGDIPRVGQRYVSTQPHEQITAEQVADLPVEVAQPIRSLIREGETKDTLEARIATDADRLECLLQAVEYAAEGYQDVGPWIASESAAVRTDSARRLASAALQTAPSDWWMSIVTEYGHGKAEDS
jgi:putative hydrolase of HD superfamily